MATATRRRTDVQFHEAANVFPLMSADEFDGLVEDIREYGLRESIKLYQGKVIDGRNRYKACLVAGIDPDYETMVFADDDEAIAFVVSQNWHRRHLDTSQRAMAAVAIREYQELAAKRRLEESHARAGVASGAARRGEENAVETLPQRSCGAKTRDVVGATVGVSGKTVDYATKVTKKGSPELIAAVKAGEVKVSTAARLAEAPKQVQTQAVREGKTAIRQAIEEHAPSPSEEARNDPGVKWHKSMREIRSRLMSTREHGGISELVGRWSQELIQQYRDDIAEMIEELETWKKELTSKLKKR